MKLTLKQVAEWTKGRVAPEFEDITVNGVTSDSRETKEGQLSELDMAKIWRGLFFCMWHSDGPFVQDALAEKLAEKLVGEEGGGEA